MANLRICGGKHKNKRLTLPVLGGTRPAQAVVRMALFNWLGNNLADKHCLDLFAGTGIISWEALSRGAASVTLIEQNPLVCRYLNQQARELDYAHSQARVLQRDVYRWLKRKQSKQFDYIFIDPPYETQYFVSCVRLVLEQNLLAPGGYIFYEVNAALHNSIPWLNNQEELLPFTTEAGGEQLNYRLLKSNNRGWTYFGLIGCLP